MVFFGGFLGISNKSEFKNLGIPVEVVPVWKLKEENTKKIIECAESIRKIIGDDIPWASEEEMIEELARDRRERWENAHHA